MDSMFMLYCEKRNANNHRLQCVGMDGICHQLWWIHCTHMGSANWLHRRTVNGPWTQRWTSSTDCIYVWSFFLYFLLSPFKPTLISVQYDNICIIYYIYIHILCVYIYIPHWHCDSLQFRMLKLEVLMLKQLCGQLCAWQKGPWWSHGRNIQHTTRLLPTVDGNQKSGINSPVEVGSLSTIIYRVFIHPRWLFGISEPSTVWPTEVGWFRKKNQLNSPCRFVISWITFPNHHFDVQVLCACLKSFEPKHQFLSVFPYL